MEHNAPQQATQPPTTLLDITKLKREVMAVVLDEVTDLATAKMHAVRSIESDSSLSKEQRRELVHQQLQGDLRWLIDTCNNDDNFGEYLHQAAHQMIDACNNDKRSGEGACKTVVMSFAQMVCLGWRLAEAHLQNLSLEQSVQ